MIDADAIKAVAGAALFVMGMIIAWVKSGSSMREKITRKRNEQNAKSSITAKERLITVTNSTDNEFLDIVRESER